ncbi:MFS transporter [Thermococcus thioreducens]|uniref:Predicted arabinose efflux permease, MFS family n=1 Tax=Thermococcus thioreducens TaxID=277988 RepID=A0A0Q2XK98_9EURY|nr:MFS transporter [Thermococcus thioreducens]ASJ13200.1 quinolone resistance protein [Thermococcus thioreducens]KQH81516.1 quinolone resistance protein [Thermococcus thioreducens]SEW20878.1 Predicted arabinose efflux permease, MFS family [Thermococcus thioreducens]
MGGRLRDVWLLNLSTFFFFLGISVVNPIISPFAITLRATPFLVGLVAGIASVISLISKPLGGLIGDRGYRFQAMILGNVLGMVAGLLYVSSALMGNLWVFAFARAIHGFSMGIFFPSSLSTAVDLAPEGRVGETLGWRGMMFSLGNIVGPALGGYLSDILGFVGAFTFTLIFALIGAAFVIPVWMGERGLQHKSVHTGHVSYSELLRPYFIAASLALFFFAFSYAGVITYLPAFYKTIDLPQRVFGLYMMVMGVASFIMRLIGGRTADRIGPIPVIRTGVLLVIAGYVVLIYYRLPYPSYISALLIGGGFGLSVPAMQLMALAPLPGRIRTMGSSVYTMFFDLGMLGGQVVLGYVAGLRGYAGVFPLLPFIAAASLIIVHAPLIMGGREK